MSCGRIDRLGVSFTLCHAHHSCVHVVTDGVVPHMPPVRCHVNFPIVSDGHSSAPASCHGWCAVQGSVNGTTILRHRGLPPPRVAHDPGRWVVNRFGFQGKNSMSRHGHDAHGDGICATVCPPRHMVDNGSGPHQYPPPPRAPRRRRQPLSFRCLIQPTCSSHMVGMARVHPCDTCRFWCVLVLRTSFGVEPRNSTSPVSTSSHVSFMGVPRRECVHILTVVFLSGVGRTSTDLPLSSDPSSRRHNAP